ncbi:DUF624 domain-containing protein [Bacillus sp. JJ1533]|uniref:YesL family protein n=1 Tax=Bacillus sp. JJ1533 TaxID=3122959 RepID=UPI003000ED22
MGKALITIMEWLYKLVFLNSIWILYSLPIVTIIPATAAMFAVMDKWIREEDDDEPYFKLFNRKFKQFFWKSYPLGLALLIIGGILIIDLLFLSNATSALWLVARYALIGVTILFFISFLYSFPIFIRYQYPWYKTMLFSFMLGIRQPIVTIMGFCGILLIVFLFLFVTGIGILFFASLFALVSTMVAQVSSKSVIEEGA